MRCVCCNNVLNDYEATRKHAETGEYLDICNECIEDIPVPVEVRSDLSPFDETEEDWDWADYLEDEGFDGEEE